jgi:hypothetical protein
MLIDHILFLVTHKTYLLHAYHGQKYGGDKYIWFIFTRKIAVIYILFVYVPIMLLEAHVLMTLYGIYKPTKLGH